MKKVLTILLFLVVSICYGQKQIWLIGTAHEEKNYINADSLTYALNKIKPDLILIELEEYVYSLKEEVGNTKIKTEEQTLFHIKEEPKKPKKIKVKVEKTEVKDEVKPLKLF